MYEIKLTIKAYKNASSMLIYSCLG